MRGLASPHPILGAICGSLGFWQSCSVFGVSGCWSRRRHCSGMCLVGLNGLCWCGCALCSLWPRSSSTRAVTFLAGLAVHAIRAVSLRQITRLHVEVVYTDLEDDSRPAQSCDFAALVGVFASGLLFSAPRFWQPLLFMSCWSSGMRIVLGFFFQRRSRILRSLVRQWIRGSGHCSHLARGHYFYGPLHLAATCSMSCRSPCMRIFLGDFQKRFRIQRYLVRQWVHGCVCLRVRSQVSVWQQRQVRTVQTVLSFLHQGCVLARYCADSGPDVQKSVESPEMQRAHPHVVDVPVVVRTVVQMCRKLWRRFTVAVPGCSCWYDRYRADSLL